MNNTRLARESEHQTRQAQKLLEKLKQKRSKKQ